MSRYHDETSQAVPRGDGMVFSENLKTLDSAAMDTSSLEGGGKVDYSGDTLEGFESSYLKELQRGVRNVSKKISAIQKVELVLANNPSLTLDELVATKKINNDQKAQVLKKPILQQSLRQLEEQLVHCKKFEEGHRQQMNRERQHLQSLHEAQLQELEKSIQKDSAKESRTEVRRQLLILSRFLRAAASRRALDADSQELSEDSKAFEGVLLLLYGGDASAVDAAEKLVNGSSEKIVSTEGEYLGVTYEKIRTLALGDSMPVADTAPRECVTEDDTNEARPEATLNGSQMDSTQYPSTVTKLTENSVNVNKVQDISSSIAPSQAVTSQDSAANTAFHTSDEQTTQHADSMADSWVAVSRDNVEIESYLNTMAVNSIRNWAEDSAELPERNSHDTVINEGFHEVHHGRDARIREADHSDRGRARFRGSAKHRDAFGGRSRAGFRSDRPHARGNRAPRRAAPQP